MIKQFKYDTQSNTDSPKMLFTFGKVGLQTAYLLHEVEESKLQIHSIVGINHHWASYDFRYEDNNSFRPEGFLNLQLVELLNTKGFGVELGARLKYKWFFIEADYNIFNGEYEIMEDFKETLKRQGVNDFSPLNELFSSLDIQIGFSVPLNKIGGYNSYTRAYSARIF